MGTSLSYSQNISNRILDILRNLTILSVNSQKTYSIFCFFKIKRKVAKTQRMENEISYKIIGAAIEVHRVLGGPGLLEGIYESCLCHELALSGFKVERQLAVPVNYKGSVV